MNIRKTTFAGLTGDEIAAWSAIQRGNPALSSPYFRPEFTQAVASVRTDVEVAVLEEAGRAVGFFPYQRKGWGAGRPVAGRLSDFHALIAPADVDCDPCELMRACGLSSWQFDHLLPTNASFARFVWSTADSPYVDLSSGFDAYVAERENGRRMLAEFGQKKRKCEREVGPLRHVPHVDDPAIVKIGIRWKSRQYDQSEADNIFTHPWVVALMEKILACRGEDFAPVVSVTYAGDEIAAINLGMRSRGVLHPWFPTYNPELSAYSPGFLHWIETMVAAESIGIYRIDLGKGDETYKRRFMTGAVRVGQGAIDMRRSVATARRIWRNTRASIKASPLYGPARVPARVIRRVRSWMELR